MALARSLDRLVVRMEELDSGLRDAQVVVVPETIPETQPALEGRKRERASHEMMQCVAGCVAGKATEKGKKLLFRDALLAEALGQPARNPKNRLAPENFDLHLDGAITQKLIASPDKLRFRSTDLGERKLASWRKRGAFPPEQ